MTALTHTNLIKHFKTQNYKNKTLKIYRKKNATKLITKCNRYVTTNYGPTSLYILSHLPS